MFLALGWLLERRRILARFRMEITPHVFQWKYANTLPPHAHWDGRIEKQRAGGGGWYEKLIIDININKNKLKQTIVLF